MLFGEGCAPDHQQGTAGGSVLNDMALARGFAVASSSNLILDQQCNDLVAAETVTMIKERIVERYGEIRYTIGNGCSGGSMLQHMIADKYPGLVDGIRPTCSFPDHWTEQAFEDHDCPLLIRYFTQLSPIRRQLLGGGSSMIGHWIPTDDDAPLAASTQALRPLGEPCEGARLAAGHGGLAVASDRDRQSGPVPSLPLQHPAALRGLRSSDRCLPGARAQVAERGDRRSQVVER